MKKILLALFAILLTHSSYALIVVESCDLPLDFVVEGSDPAVVSIFTSVSSPIISLDWIFENEVYQDNGNQISFTFESGVYTVCASAALDEPICQTAYGCVDIVIEGEPVEDCEASTASITMEIGSFGNEVSWELLSSNSADLVAQGEDYMSNLTYFQDLCLEDGCYTLLMDDSFGDGWNGAVFNIAVNGEAYSATIESGSAGVFSFVVGESDCGILGCTNPAALNYNADAETDDGTCEYPEACESHWIASGFWNSQSGNFIDCSVGTIVSYEWDFGDGNTSTEEDPSHVYEEPGVYTVCLTVYSAVGCISTECNDVTVSEEPDCESHWLASGFSSGFSGNFLDCSIGTIISYEWDFGDGNTSTEESPSHAYDEPGVYTVCQTVYGLDGCVNTECQEVTVNEAPPPPPPVGDSIYLDYECNEFFYTLTFETAQFGQENSWDIVDEEGNILATGDSYSSYGSYLQELCLPTECFTLNMYDSFGDGWHGAVLLLIADDGNIITATIETGNVGSVSTECEPEPEPEPELTLCGTLTTGNADHDQEVSGRVFLVELNPEDGSLSVVQTLFWGTGDGDYCFVIESDGQYIIKADLKSNSPHFEDYFPTYLGDVLSWEDSPLISVGGGSITNLDITLIPNVDQAPGNGTVDGMVEPGPGKVGEEIGEILVYLTDMDGNAIDFSWLSEEGYFMIDALPTGEYWLHVDALGANNQPILITISDESSTWNFNFIMYSETMEVENWSVSGDEASGIETIAAEEIQVYPNPAVDVLMITLDGKWQAQIVNLQGQIISSQEITSNNGRLEIVVQELPHGNYLVRLIQNDQQAIIPFVKL